MASVDLNVTAAWIAIVCGLVWGAIVGLFFKDDHWLGGYGSWPRRMLRLGHISFFGIALLNLMFVNTVDLMGMKSCAGAASVLLVVANFAMPVVCILSAWRKGWTRWFVVPVGATVAAAGLVVWAVSVRGLP